MAKKKTVGGREGDWMRVWVEWVDSCKFSHPWWSFEDFKASSSKHSVMTSVGYLFHEDEYFIYLASSLHWDEGETVVQFGNISSIPKAAIITQKSI